MPLYCSSSALMFWQNAITIYAILGLNVLQFFTHSGWNRIATVKQTVFQIHIIAWKLLQFDWYFAEIHIFTSPWFDDKFKVGAYKQSLRLPITMKHQWCTWFQIRVIRGQGMLYRRPNLHLKVRKYFAKVMLCKKQDIIYDTSYFMFHAIQCKG